MQRVLSYLVIFLSLLVVAKTYAQDNGFGTQQAPLDLIPELPALNDFTPQADQNTDIYPTRMVATLFDGAQPIENGLVWRIFNPTPDDTGKLPLLIEVEGGSSTINLPQGDYFVHVAFGRAGVTKRISVPSSAPQENSVFVLDAGGLVLNAVAGSNVRIAETKLRFSIYTSVNDIEGNQRLILDNVMPNTIIRLNEGIYHIESKYGDINAVTRADIRVTAGKLTEVELQHRAAEVTFKLVSKEGGEGIADTAWAVFGSSGDTIEEMVGAFPRLILSEGDYTVVATHKDINNRRNFTITPGLNTDIEVKLGEE